jgi:hypothetical protein
MDFVGGVAVQVHELLGRYFAIHERVFKFSVGKVLPIPGLFPRIDHRARRDSLMSIHRDLILAADALARHHNCGVRLSNHPFVLELEAYARHVADSARRLSDICLALYLKSEARPQYNASTYKSDVTAYDASVEACRVMGSRLNDSFADYRKARDKAP